MPSALFQKLGRKRPDAALMRKLRPREPRREMYRYLKKIDAFWNLWRGAVASELDIRLDASEARYDAKILEATFNQLLQNAGLEKFLTDLGKDLSDRAQKYMKNIVRIPATVPGKDQLVESFRARNIALIKDVGREQVENVTEILRTASANGLRAETFTAEIAHALDVGQSRAELIARDQTLKFNSQVTMQAAKDAGATEYIWSTSQDERVRDGTKGPSDHKSLNGRRFAYDDPPETEPGVTNNPGEDYQCRCAAIPVFSLFE